MQSESAAPRLLSTRAPLFARPASAGEAVLCLHASHGSPAQWRGLAAALLGRAELVAPHLCGRSPTAWPQGAAHGLQVDAHAARALLPGSNNSFAPPGLHLVGHSYGGALALQMALQQPRRVRSLTLYEPLPFGVIRSAAPADEALGEIEAIAGAVEALVRRGDLEGAARIFVGYWGGATAWQAMDPAQRAALRARMASVAQHSEALFRATWTPRLLACLQMPVLLIYGAATRAPARRLIDLLGAACPQAQCVEIAGAGHFGPMTHPAEVNAAISRHLSANGLQGQRAQPSHSRAASTAFGAWSSYLHPAAAERST